MTNREFYTTIASGIINAEITAFAENALAKLDEKNAKRKLSESALARAAETENFRSEVLAIFTADNTLLATAADVGAKLGVTTAKASGALTALVKAGSLTKEEVKIHASKKDGIKGKVVNGYRLAK